MPLIRTPTRLARLPTLLRAPLLRAPLCRRCTSGATSEYLQGPSEKQLAYAQALAEQVGVDVPEDVRADKIACSEFIDQQLRRVPPTDKQLAYAEALAEKFGADVPEDVRTSKIACSDFIDQQKQREPPSEKQLAFVRELAQQAQIDPPDRACVSSAGASHHALLHAPCTTLRPCHAHATSIPRAAFLTAKRAYCLRTVHVLLATNYRRQRIHRRDAPRGRRHRGVPRQSSSDAPGQSEGPAFARAAAVCCRLGTS